VKKIVLWLMSTVTALVLLFGYHTSTSSQAAAGGQSSAVAPVSGGTSGTAGSSSGTSSGSSSTGTSGSAVSKTVSGDVADTRWGPVQVQLTVASGKITNVSVVEYPNNNPRDQEINAQALPILVQETLSAQSAHIDMVSGATVTSDGYLQSLQSALDKAGL
jgi:major membrane immunogen (membrane-anchored lipoprotein)